MSSNHKTGFFSNLKNDLPASVVVFLVAMPLCLGIALASDAPLFSGIIAGIVGGTVVALISGSPLGVSGPAAGLAVIVANSIKDFGEVFETFLLAVVIAGALQIIAGFLKAGVIGYYFPNSVIKGMLAGIGLLIFFKQFPHAFGYEKDPEGDWSFLQSDGENTFSAIAAGFEALHWGTLLITVVGILILILWERPFMKKLSFTKVIQGPLVVVIVGILGALMFDGMATFQLGTKQLVSVLPESPSAFFEEFRLPDFTQITNSKVWMTAIVIAVVASLETLLCVEATDKLDPEKRVTPTNRELIAQGAGNMISGLIGGLPITQVIVRSSANIQSGGKSKASAFFHGLLLIGCVLIIPGILNLIPYASLAAILFIVGYKLAKPSMMIEIYKKGWGQFIPFAVTVLGIVFTDLLIGIGLGLAVAILQIMWNSYKTPYHFDEKAVKPGEPIKINLSEDVSFLNKAGIIHTLELLPDDCEVIIDGTKTKIIHPDILDLIDDFQSNAPSRGIKLELVGFTRFGVDHPLGKFKEQVNALPNTGK